MASYFGKTFVADFCRELSLDREDFDELFGGNLGDDVKCEFSYDTINIITKWFMNLVKRVKIINNEINNSNLSPYQDVFIKTMGIELLKKLFNKIPKDDLYLWFVDEECFDDDQNRIYIHCKLRKKDMFKFFLNRFYHCMTNHPDYLSKKYI